MMDQAMVFILWDYQLMQADSYHRHKRTSMFGLRRNDSSHQWYASAWFAAGDTSWS